MFRPSPEPLLLSEAGLHGLCPSLNAPVLNVDEVPVGPARAAIVLFAGDHGALRLGVGLRSVESGATAVFLYAGEVGEFRTPARAMDAALTFAEAMGFLFDEDLVGREGRAAALQHWKELMGDGTPGEAAAELPEIELLGEIEDAELPELAPVDEAEADLPEAIEVTITPEVKVEVDPPRPEAAATAPADAATLSKFRRAAQAGSDARPARPGAKSRRTAGRRKSGESGGNELGRIALVRKRLGGDGGPERPGLLMRLLSSF